MAGIYDVKSGDTLGSIAKQHGMSFNDLLVLNPQFNKNTADGVVANHGSERAKAKAGSSGRDSDFILVGEKIRVASDTRPQTPKTAQPNANAAPAAKKDTVANRNQPARDTVKTAPPVKKDSVNVVASAPVSTPPAGETKGGPPNTPPPSSEPSTAAKVADTAASLLVPGYDLYKAFNDPNATAWDYAWGVVTAIPAAKVVTSGIKGVRLLATATKLAKVTSTIDKAADAGKAADAALDASKAALTAKKTALKAEVVGDLTKAAKWTAGTAGVEGGAWVLDKAIGGAKAGQAPTNGPTGDDIALDKMLATAAGSGPSNVLATHYVVGFKTQLNSVKAGTGGAPLVLLYATIIPKKDFHQLNLKDPGAFQKLLNNSVQFVAVNRTPLKAPFDATKSPNAAAWLNPTSTVLTYNPKTGDWETGYGRVMKQGLGGHAFANYRMDIPGVSQSQTASLPSFNYGMFWEAPKGGTMKKLTNHLADFVAESVDDILGKTIFKNAHGVKQKVATEVTEEAISFSLRKGLENLQPIIGVANRGSVEWKDGGIDGVKIWGGDIKW